MQITIIGVSIEDVKTAKGGYQKADVAYKNEQGKTEGKKVMSFVNQKVFDVLKQAKSGDVFDVKSEKDANNYWQWVDITAGGSAPTCSTPAAPSKTTVGNPSPKSTYETPEERAKKQVYIVRQSSISAAIEYSKSVKALKSTEEVIALARQFEAYVFEEAFEQAKTAGGLFDMKDDTDGIV